VTDSDNLKALRESCRTFLKDSDLKFMVDQDDDFVLLFPEGVQVLVMPREMPDGHTVVRVEALCVKGVRVDGELALFIAEANAKMLFSTLTLYADRQEVHLEEALLGDFLNRAELELAVHLVALATDLYDDQIKERWGGKKRGDL
jgi:hypothetical protein